MNVGYGKDITICGLAESISFEGAMEFDVSYPDDVLRKLLDTSRLFSLGWKPRISLLKRYPVSV
jgi:nucleoside-diphosphate-sugar epimerase